MQLPPRAQRKPGVDFIGRVQRAASGSFRYAKDFIHHPELSSDERRMLQAQAHAYAARRAGRPASPWNQARSAHDTNTVPQLLAALKDPNIDWMEGDLRLEGFIDFPIRQEDAILAHDVTDVDGLHLRDWLSIAKDAGIGVKLDFSKDLRTLPLAIRALRQATIPDDKLILNLHVVGVPPASPGAWLNRSYDVLVGTTVPWKDVQRLRTEFPRAMLALGMTKTSQQRAYAPEQVKKLIQCARQVGGPLMFPLQADLVTPELIRTLKPYGKVSVWNDLGRPPRVASQAEATRVADTFRAMGMDGLIDIRPTP
jgi:hypothetical protein